MADQFVVPQFLDVESKIFGPITVRQFSIMMGVGLLGVINYRLADFSLFLLMTIPEVAIAILFAFVKIHGQGFHLIVLNVIQTFRKPSMRVWNKNRSDSELRAYLNRKAPKAAPIPYRKKPLSGSRLRDLSLVVNTGGVYVPDDENK